VSLALARLLFREAALMIALGSGLLVVFSAMFVFIMKDVSLPAVFKLFDFAAPMLGIPLSKLGSPEGTFSVVFVDGPTLIICIGWAITRGSDAVSGQLGRGVFETILAQPITRGQVLLLHSLVTLLGSAIISASIWLGIAIGIVAFGQLDRVSPLVFWPGSVNMFFFLFALVGITTFVSSFESQRWRTIGIVIGFYCVSLMLKVLSRVWEDGAWLNYLSLPGAYEPQRLVIYPERIDELLAYNGVFLVVGLLSYALAFVIFTRRDLPPPP
jgi:ABC-2 type transport system permease protein